MEDQDFRIIKGTVVATKDRVTGGDGTVSSVPEMWIKDQDGKEQLFTGHIFREVRAGHEAAVVVEYPSEELICFVNYTTGNVIYDARITLLEGSSAEGFATVFLDTFFFGVILAIPALIIFFILGAVIFEPLGISIGAAFQISSVLWLGASFWLASQRMARINSNTQSLRSRVDAALADLKETSA